MVKEMARVARPGAVVAGLNEGTRGLRRSPDNPNQEGEKALGINEHVHSVWAYAYAFTRAGLIIRRLERPGRLAAVAVRRQARRKSPRWE